MGYTKQQSLVLQCFKNEQSAHFTADEICDLIKGNGVSRATVYRTIEKLTEEGVIIKFNFGKSQSACYQFCSQGHNASTYHFVCTSCKTVKHLQCNIFGELQEHLKERHSIQIDPGLTVIYGVCERCLNK